MHRTQSTNGKQINVWHILALKPFVNHRRVSMSIVSSHKHNILYNKWTERNLDKISENCILFGKIIIIDDGKVAIIAICRRTWY